MGYYDLAGGATVSSTAAPGAIPSTNTGTAVDTLGASSALIVVHELPLHVTMAAKHHQARPARRAPNLLPYAVVSPPALEATLYGPVVLLHSMLSSSAAG